jgi:hypothetical protein
MKTFEFDGRGAAYLRTRLTEVAEWGGTLHVLSTALDVQLASALGRTWTLAPSETSPDHLYQFQRGGLLPENLDLSRAADVGDGSMMAIHSLKDEERVFLRNLLNEQTGSVCLIVDPLLKRGDPSITDFYATTAIYAADQVFHVVDATTDEETLACSLTAAPFWMDLRMVTGLPPECRLHREVANSDLVASASAVTAISCSAYDGEGFVVWQRASD